MERHRIIFARKFLPLVSLFLFLLPSPAAPQTIATQQDSLNQVELRRNPAGVTFRLRIKDGKMKKAATVRRTP